MSGWNHDGWDADRPAPQPWDPQRWDPEPWTDVGRPARDWAAAQVPTSGHGVGRAAGPGPVLLAAAGGAVVATGLGLLVLLLGGVLVAMVLGALVLLGAGALGAAWVRGAR